MQASDHGSDTSPEEARSFSTHSSESTHGSDFSSFLSWLERSPEQEMAAPVGIDLGAGRVTVPGVDGYFDIHIYYQALEDAAVREVEPLSQVSANRHGRVDSDVSALDLD